jgi:putative sulfotransferase
MSAAPVFIVSTGRCGSTMLSNMVRLHPRLLSISELFASIQPVAFPPGVITAQDFWTILARPLPLHEWLFTHGLVPDEVTYDWRSPSARFRSPGTIPPIALTTLPHLSDRPDELLGEIGALIATFPPAPIEQHYRRLFDRLCDRFAREIWVERSGGSLELLPMMAERFPDARFVHLWRDGRETALSMSRHPIFRIRVVMDQLQQWLGDEALINGAPQDVIEQKVPREWRPMLPWAFEPSAFARFDLPLEEFGRRWSDQIIAGVDCLAALPPQRVMTMSFEQILARPRDELQRLGDFIRPGIADESWIEAASQLCRPNPMKWVKLDQPVRDRLVEACLPGMSRLSQ